jgi:hypothetical protein
MAPGFFEKVFDFVKEKVVNPVVQKVLKPIYQKVVKPVYETLKPVLKPVLQTVLQTKGIPAPASELLFEGGEALADHFLGEKRQEHSSVPRIQQEVVEQTVYVDENGNPISEADLRSGKYGPIGGELAAASKPIGLSTLDLMRSNLRSRK